MLWWRCESWFVLCCSYSIVSHKYVQNRLRRHLLGMCPHLPEGALELLEKMLKLDPVRRISAEEAFRVGCCLTLAHVLSSHVWCAARGECGSCSAVQ